MGHTTKHLTLAAAVHSASFVLFYWTVCKMQSAAYSVEWVVHPSRTVDLWTCGCVDLWIRWFVDSWIRGFMDLWICGFVDLLIRGFVESWIRGFVEVWHSLKSVSVFLADHNPTEVLKLKSSQSRGRWIQWTVNHSIWYCNPDICNAQRRFLPVFPAHKV